LKEKTYKIQSFDNNKLNEFIDKPYSAVISGTSLEYGEIYDTFDWLLFKSGFTAFYTPSLLRIYNNSDLAQTPLGDPPALAKNLPKSAVKSIISSAAGHRALMKKSDCTISCDQIKITDDEGKTVVKLETAEVTINSSSSCFVKVIPLRGYESEFGLVQAALEDAGAKQLRDTIFPYLIKKSGLNPAFYKSKITAGKNPDEPAEFVIKDILLGLLEVMELNEEGIINATDIEFLHDFRVSVRRSRSALSIIKNVFPADKTAYFKGKLSELGSVTNLSRDLDVYIEKMDDYRQMLPEQMRDGLNTTEKFLKETKKKEHKALSSFLKSPAYNLLKSEWREYLTSSDGDSATVTGKSPIRPLAAESLKTAMAKVVKDGGLIKKDSNADSYHKLRIHCKKLRYLLEFFSVLFNSKTSEIIIERLKQLQDSLGLHQDYEVQQEKLLGYTKAAAEKSPDAVSVSVASGYLVRLLAEMQENERKNCRELIKRFISAETKELFKEMVGL
jgi:CHAD domain-containing protein